MSNEIQIAQRPSYLQPSAGPRLVDAASQGIGGILPPHISIRGNRFTLFDASGNKAEVPTVFLDVIVIDVCNPPGNFCKQFYPDDWNPDSSDPPACWSANGIGPSSEAMEPQAVTCASCPNNERGSAHSKLSGKGIKACRDEKWLAVVPLIYPTMLFQLKITPGSFKNWSKHTEFFKKNNGDLNELVTRVSFEAEKNGVLTFNPTGEWINQQVYATREAALRDRKTDVLVGRNDVPRTLAIAGPATAPAGQPLLQTEPGPGFGAMPRQEGLPPMPAPQEAPAPAGQRRKRRTAAEIAADNAAKANPAPAGQAPVAPFRPAAEQPAGFGATQPPGGTGAAAFGIAAGVAPNPELQATLNSVFGKS